MSDYSMKSDTAGGLHILLPVGRLDSVTAKQFEGDLIGQVQAGQTRILLDFAELSYISSAGLRVVLLAGKQIKGKGGVLALCNLSPAIRTVFEVSGFLTLFPCYASRPEAVAAQGAAA